LKLARLGILFLIGILVLGCDPDKGSSQDPGRSLTDISYSPSPMTIEIPETFPQIEFPSENEMTEEKVELGQHLFFDPILSIDSTMACASCHFPESGFTDNKAVSIGVDGIAGNKSSMSLVNVAFYNTGLFWDGRIGTLEEQALLPVEDPIELHNNWPGLMDKLKEHDEYPEMFRKAFGISNTNEMTKELAAKALAQYQRVIISGNSYFDRTLPLSATVALSDDELEGFELFFGSNLDELPDAHCGHCHTAPLFTSNAYANNGLTEVQDVDDFEDIGYGKVTGNPLDNGKFRIPTLRNVGLTAPYMHDGRFETLEEVIDHYDSGGVFSPNKDPFIIPLGLTDDHKEKIKLFILTLVDTSYLENEYVKNPFH